jgi:hypothetical protein
LKEDKMALITDIRKIKGGYLFTIRGAMTSRVEKSGIEVLLKPKILRGIRNFVVVLELSSPINLGLAEDLAWSQHFIEQAACKMIILDPTGSVKLALDAFDIGNFTYNFAKDEAEAQQNFLH